MTRRTPAPLPWLAGLLALYLIAPLVAGALQGGLADWHSVDTEALLRASLVSIASASLATVIIALGGIPLGYVLARVPGRAMAVLSFLVQLPLALPPLASGILLLFLVGYSAPLGRLAQGALTDSYLGIVLAETFVAAPFLIIAARSGFAAMDPVLEGVGATLGRRPLDVFLRVSLPIAWPTLRSGLLLAWLRAFGEFGATVMVAYHPYSLPVYTYVAFGAEGLPAMLPVLLPTLGLALGIMALSGLAAADRAEGRYATLAAGELTPSAAPALPAARPPERLPPVDLAMRLEKRLGDFRLDMAWSPRTRRLAILGPSGSGKSLTLKLLTGIEPSDRGSILLGQRELSPLDPAARSIAYVPQNYGLFPHLTVLQQLRFPVGAEAGAAQRWIDRLGLGGLEQRFPAALSLGQQQRVALARALVRPAELLLLDEPFSALDAPLRASLRQELRELQAELGPTTILVTHDPAEAALLADELLVLEAGRVLQSGPTGQVFRRPANETVARLLGATMLAKGVAVAGDHIAIGGGVLLRVAGPALGLGERVGWSLPQGCVALGAGGAYQGTVESQSVIGAERRITLRLGNARIELPVGRTDLGSGALCRFDIDPQSIQLWPLDQPRGTQALIGPLPTISTSAP